MAFRAAARRWQCGRLALVLLWITACGGRTPVPTAPPPPETHVGPLVQLLPPGLSLVLSARPKQLAQHASARALWRSVVPEERELAFVERTGVDPLTVEEFVGVELAPNGYVLLARGPFDAADVVKRAGERIAVPDVNSDDPLVRREGLRGDGRYAYVALDSHAVLAAKDAPPELIGQFLARRTDAKAARAFDTNEVHALERDHASAPLVLYQLTPLEFGQGSQVALLFARQRALALAVRPTEHTLEVALDMRGEFPPGAEHNFRALVRSMGQAPLGSALGLARIAEQMGVRMDEQGVLMSASLDTNEIIAALRLMFAVEMRQLFE